MTTIILLLFGPLFDPLFDHVTCCPHTLHAYAGNDFKYNQPKLPQPTSKSSLGNNSSGLHTIMFFIFGSDHIHLS